MQTTSITVGVEGLRKDNAIGTKWLTIYWVSTMYVGLTAFAAGVGAIVHAPAVIDEVLRLGYPLHFASLLGVWEVLGAIALCTPRRALIKEWAYAGLFIDFSGAVVAHASVGDSLSSYIGPMIAMAALIVSGQLRPQFRRLVGARLGD